MRPVRLDLEGFASYREPTALDFTDADYFALTGATGAGKSTIIDAITFALYGTAPRWNHATAVSYALAPTCNRATVSLIFDIADQRYQVAREVRRVGGHVQQKTARLERFLDPTAAPAPGDPAPDTEVLASEVRDITPAVADLLGLDFDDFCQCVVLPQGEFAKFLKATSGARQDILLKLLGADQYDKISKAAGARARAAEQERTLWTGQLDDIHAATPEEIAAASERRDQLANLAKNVAGLTGPVLQARTDEARARAAAQSAEQAAQTLTHVAAPDGVAERHQALTRARSAAEAAKLDNKTTAENLRNAISAADTGPRRDVLVAVSRGYAELDGLASALTEADTALQQALAREDDASAETKKTDREVTDAKTRHTSTLKSLDQARQRRDELVARIGRLADVAAPADVDQVKAATVAAEAAVTATEAALGAARRETIEAAEACQPLPDPRAISAHAEERARLVKDTRTWEHDKADLEQRRRQEADAKAELTTAGQERDTAARRLETARARAGAAALRPALQVGHECPVCTQQVTVIPPPAEDDTDLQAAEQEWDEADQRHTQTQQQHRTVANQLALDEQRHEDRGHQIAATATRLAATATQLAQETGHEVDQPLLPQGWALSLDSVAALDDALDDALASIQQRCQAARDRLDRARLAAEEAETARETARNDREASQALVTQLRTALVRVHADLHADEPPPIATDTVTDVIDSWRSLTTWASSTRADATQTRLPAAEEALAEATSTHGEAKTRLDKSEKAAADAHTTTTEAAAAAAAARTRRSGIEARRKQLTGELADAPARADLPALLAEADRLRADQDRAAAAAEQAEEVRSAAADALTAATKAVSEDRAALSAARDRLAAWTPPTFTSDRIETDLTGCWDDLIAWATTRSSACEHEAEEAAQAAEDAAARAADLLATLTGALTGHDLPVDGVEDDPRTAEKLVGVAAAEQAAVVTTMEDAAKRAESLRKNITEATERQQVAAELARLMRADQFPRWLATAALDTLVAGASDSLARLSDGRFSLSHRKGEFFVIDHFDADSERSVRTLSGGETFQASLALALALSEQLAALAAGGAAKLDSIFLDEGFGTLDPESLEMVAATLENLAEGERMVGIVTHVSALAERTPVRFRVTHDSRTSRIEREAM